MSNVHPLFQGIIASHMAALPSPPELSHEDMAADALNDGETSYWVGRDLYCAEHPGEEIDDRYGCRHCPPDA